MIDQRMRIGVLSALDPVKTINHTLGPFVLHHDVNVMTRKSGAQINRGGFVFRLWPENGVR